MTEYVQQRCAGGCDRIRPIVATIFNSDTGVLVGFCRGCFERENAEMFDQNGIGD